jgi:hypothetical protein
MTSFNDILNDDNLNGDKIKNNSLCLKNDHKHEEPLFILDDTIPKDKLIFNEIHYLDSSKTYTQKKPLGEYTLKIHQHTTLNFMIGLENMLYNVKTIKANNVIEYTNHYTNIGILSDQVGAGKSYCIMALLNENKNIINKEVIIRNTSIGSSNITAKQINKLNTNILLVPHSLIGQWSQYLEKSGLKYHTIQKSKDVYGIADNKCKFKDILEDENQDETEIKEETKIKSKPLKKNAKKNAKDSSINTNTSTDTDTDIITKPKKKIVLKKNSKKEVKEIVEEKIDEKVEIENPLEIKDSVELVEPIIHTKLNIRKIKSDKKKQLDIERRNILNQIDDVRGKINVLYYNPNYRFIDNNQVERELVHKEIANLKIILSNLDNKYLEVTNSIKNFELEYGSVSSGQLILLNDFNTIFNNKNDQCYNPNYINKDMQDFLINMSHINKPYVESLDVILVSDTFYNFFSLYLTKDNYTVNRIIIDECNSIKGSQLFNINTIFTWLVTSSISSLMTNSGYITKQITSPQGYLYNSREKTIMSTGFVLNTISRLYEYRDNFKLYLINNPEYIKQSILLPVMQTFVIVCKDNVIIQVLNGIVTDDIMRMLNAGDIEGIITKMDVVVGDESNIISIITQKYTDDLLIKEYELKVAIENPKYKPENESISIANKRIAITDLKYKISCIEDRIKNADSCPICIDDFINPIVTPCCNNKYCFNCITLSLNSKNTCPSCRKVLEISKLLVVSNKLKNSISTLNQSDNIISKLPKEIKTYTEKIQYLKCISINSTKYENMDRIFELNNDNSIKKYLIFTEYETTLNTKITSILEKWNLKYDRIRGSSATINKQLEKYKSSNGETNVLLVNSKFFGSGMNLENTTDIIIMHKMQSDIEMQAIGRAQRFGRVGELRVWKLYYQNESL